MGFWKCVGKASLCAAKVVGESVVGAVDGAIDATKDEIDKDHSGRSKKAIAFTATVNILGSAVGRGAKAGFHSLGEELGNYQQFAEADEERDKTGALPIEQERLVENPWVEEKERLEREAAQERAALAEAEEKERLKREHEQERMALLEAENKERLERERVEQRIALSEAENKQDFGNVKTKITHSKVAGVTHGNRQDNIKELVEGEYLKVQRDPHNTYDSNAIALYAQENMIGHISSSLASILAPRIDAKEPINVRVSQITGRQYGTLGVNIEIEQVDRTVV